MIAIPSLQYELSVLLKAVRQAGEAILAVRRNGFEVQRKKNNEILTEADLQANAVLKKILLTAFPEDGWLSEESVDAQHRLTADRVWIVDPIDGTKEFAQGIPEYAISVALVQQGKPCLAAIYNPETDELFHAIKNAGAWQGEKQLFCSDSTADRLKLFASRSECERGEWDAFIRDHDVTVIGSIAYKLALVAAGQAEATFSLGPKNEWDIAAGVLLIEEAGGIVTDQKRKSLQFNQKTTLVDGIVASATKINERLHRYIAEC